MYGGKGVYLFHKVLSEFWSVAFVSECLFVLNVSGYDAFAGLAHIHLIAVGTHEFADPILCAFICIVVFMC